MKPMTNGTLRTILAALAVLVFTAAAAAAEIHRRSFDVGDGGRLEVGTDVGSIEVEAAGSGRVEIEVEATGPRADELKLDFSQSGDDVTVRGKLPRRGLIRWGSGPRVKYTITVPARYDVDLGTAGGSI